MSVANSDLLQVLNSEGLYRPYPNLALPVEVAILPVDKPAGKSSFWIIRVLRGILGVKKIGHAGTLDPMATGLLICMVGSKATRMAETFVGMPKEYTGVMRLGQTTASYDAESEILLERPWEHITDEMIRTATVPFTGTITQVPPVFSAIKVGGERLYKRARKGDVDVVVPPRQVDVTAFEITGRDGRDVSFRVACSKGTYIRSLAHDLGAHLGCGAHLVALRRTAIGTVRVEEAWTVDALRSLTRRAEGGP